MTSSTKLLKVCVAYADFTDWSKNIGSWHRHYLSKGGTNEGWVAPYDLYDYLTKNRNGKALKVFAYDILNKAA